MCELDLVFNFHKVRDKENGGRGGKRARESYLKKNQSPPFFRSTSSWTNSSWPAKSRKRPSASSWSGWPSWTASTHEGKTGGVCYFDFQNKKKREWMNKLCLYFFCSIARAGVCAIGASSLYFGGDSATKKKKRTANKKNEPASRLLHSLFEFPPPLFFPPYTGSPTPQHNSPPW